MGGSPIAKACGSREPRVWYWAGFFQDGPKEYVQSLPPVDDICPNNDGEFTFEKLFEVTKDWANLETVADWLGSCLLEEGAVGIGGE